MNIEGIADMDDLEQRAQDLSDLARPPRWRVFKHRLWRNHRQPEHYRAALSASLFGDPPPIRRMGIRITDE